MRVTRVTPWLLSLMVSLGLLVGGPGSSIAQGARSIGVDADPSGNTATSLGTVDSCIEVKSGDTFEVDLIAEDLTDLLAWEVYFGYDPSVVTIVDRDVQMFLAANPGSDVFDASEGLPDIDGLYRLAAVDLSRPHAPDSGSGVLARLTLQAVASGVSPADVAFLDVDGDGSNDLGPLLTDDQGNKIGPLDSGGFFAGPIDNATIAVDSACGEATPTPPPTTPETPSPADSPTPEGSPQPTFTATATPAGASPTAAPASPTATAAVGNGENGDDGPPWVIAYVTGGIVGALALITGAAVFVRSRRGRIG